MRHLCLLILSFLVFPFSVYASERLYLRILASSEKDGATGLILGRVHQDQLFLLMADQTLSVFPLKKDMSGTGADQITPAQVVDPLRPSLQHAISGAEVGRCEKSREFQSFLLGLAAMGEGFADFEVTSSNSKFNECAVKVAAILLEKGFRASVTSGSLQSGGGVSVRAYLKGYGEPKVETSARPYRIIVTDAAGGKKSELNLNNEGFFIKSYFPQPGSTEVARVIAVMPTGEKFETSLTGIPQFKTGITNTSLFGADYLEVVAGRYDHVAQLKIPDLFIRYAARQEMLKSDKERLSWKYWLSSVNTEGTGLKAASGILPLGLGARYRLTDRVAGQLEGIAPVKLGESVPVLTTLSFDLNYWLKGQEDMSGDPSLPGGRLGVAAGGFYYSGRGAEDADARYMLSDLLGVYLGLKGDWTFASRLDRLYVDINFAPLPKTQVNEFSFSSAYKMGYERRVSGKSLIFAEYSAADYNVKYLDFGNLNFKIFEARLGYRYELD